MAESLMNNSGSASLNGQATISPHTSRFRGAPLLLAVFNTHSNIPHFELPPQYRNHPTKLSDRSEQEKTHYLPNRVLCLSGFLWDILNYGRTKNRVRVQDTRFQELAVNYQNTVLKTAQEMEDAMVAFLKKRWPRRRPKKLAKAGLVAFGILDWGLRILD
jgi:hypothetical protein